MSDRYYFSGQFKCMYCKIDIDGTKELGELGLTSEDTINLTCPKCGAKWQFWVSVQLNHRLLKGGKFNKNSSV